ncbi:MAG: hypothetical protein N2255_01965, partial [Kiritimatiellae bacterium]|nr:hypothetical protein [Kiritimatiellia bacterium]
MRSTNEMKAASPGSYTVPLTKPPWLRVKLPSGKKAAELARIVRQRRLHTVCQEALCPNVGTCWRHGHVTVMILGETCTRRCGFCNVRSGEPAASDPTEPARVAAAIRDLNPVSYTHLTLP